MTVVETDPGRTSARLRTHPHRFLHKTGWALVVSGLAVLGYVGWELLGTTWVAQHQQGRAVEATERVWATGTHGPASEEDRELAGDVEALIRVPAWGEDYVVPAYRGTDDDTLQRGFGIFDGSSRPGAAGNLALGGHRVTHGEPLRRMPSLDVGDEIVVQTRDATYRYVLDTAGDSRTVGADATWVNEDVPVDPLTDRQVSDVIGSSHLITLVTCAEIFHTDDRLVAFGHLVARDPGRAPGQAARRG